MKFTTAEQWLCNAETKGDVYDILRKIKHEEFSDDERSYLGDLAKQELKRIAKERGKR